MMRQSEAQRLENEKFKRQAKDDKSAKKKEAGKGMRSPNAIGATIVVVLLLVIGGVYLMMKGEAPSVIPRTPSTASSSSVSSSSELDALGADSSDGDAIDSSAGGGGGESFGGDAGGEPGADLVEAGMTTQSAQGQSSEAAVEEVFEEPPLPPKRFEPPSPPESFTRWAALNIPETCLRPGVSPSGIIPGLELHDREGVEAHYLVRPEGTTQASTSPGALKQTSEQAAEHEAVKEEVAEAKEDLKDAVEELKEEVAEEQEDATAVEIADEMTEDIADVEAMAAEAGDVLAAVPAAVNLDSFTTPTPDDDSTPAAPLEVEAGVATVEEAAAAAEEEAVVAEVAEVAEEAEVPASIITPNDDTTNSASSEKKRRHRGAARRTLLGRKGPVAAIPIQRAQAAPAYNGGIRQRSAGPTSNPLLMTESDAEEYETSAQTEKKVMHLVANVSLFDIACQFTTAECADAAALQLAAALRADAEAVINPDVTPEELRRVSMGLASLHSNSRSMLNASALPAMGKAGALGSCALSSDAEYDPSGRRYDATVSRFATVIDLHDTLVYCAPEAHYCKFTKLTQPISEVTVRLDAQSYLLAKTSGQAIHAALSGDAGLGNGVRNWGHAGDPTHQFITTIQLLRSGLCSRLDVYGQPSIPLEWYRSQGYGHITAVPGNTPEDKILAKTLVQERFFYRVVMHEGKMCFFK